MQFALTYAPSVFDTRDKMMGRQSAGIGFLKAALDYGPAKLWCYTSSRSLAQTFADDVVRLISPGPEIRFIPLNEPGRLANPGILYRADPAIGEDAWNRCAHAGARAYSLCGITHTLSSHGAASFIRDIISSPLYPWDAIICTSAVARDVFRVTLEIEMEYLRSRFGAARFTLPQLPLIPLGVHVSEFAFSKDVRNISRARLGLGEADVAALFAGRITFHGKGHPLPMFVGLEQAARESGVPVSLVLFGQFPNAGTEKVFREEAARFAPSIRLIVLDGKKDEDRTAAWAAADLFTSLSDNIQETFGLTPVEAMAAGLPVVVSDWNGYKDTVRDGIDGFRVPVTMPPPGAGEDLADRHTAGIDNYDIYIGQVSLFTAVDAAAAAAAYRKLIESPELRRRMGEAGRRRAAESFEWSLIFRRYVALWDELAERRRADPKVPGEDMRGRRSDRQDPFATFRTFPTQSLSAKTAVRLKAGVGMGDVEERRKLLSVSYAAAVLPSDALVAAILSGLSDLGWLSMPDLLAACRPASQRDVLRAVAWLAKMDLVELRHGSN